ncbi:MAG: dockerin type I repeat-containing protein [candidate division Zixibacteria bacterium]|nr:dockerin type I repeat-containing protein [candidate division Zixibacteria bacterium]
MSFKSQSHFIIIGALVVGLLSAIAAVPAGAEEAMLPEITLRVSDTTVQSSDTNAWISVFMRNFSDTLAGFSLMLLLDRQNLIEFRTDVEDTLIDTTWQYCIQWYQGACIEWRDTTIVDTIITSGAIDTIGGAIAGWELVTAKSVSGSPHTCKITCLADRLGPPVHTGLPPSTQERRLFSLKMRVYQTLPESLANYITNVAIVDNLNETSFSDPHGVLIGTITQYSICDTLYKDCASPENYPSVPCTLWINSTAINPEDADTAIVDTFYHFWKCTDWSGDSCLNWADTTRLEADSIWIEPRPWTVRDPSVTFYSDGSLELLFAPACICGDANNDGKINVGDAVFLISYIFRGGAVPPYLECADPNGDNKINVGDAVFLISYIFRGGTAPHCD